MRLWEVSTGRCLRTFQGHTGPVRSVGFSPDGRHALSGGDDGTMRLWEAASGQCLRTFQGHAGPVRSVGFSPDGCHVLSGSDDGTLKLRVLDWGLEERQPIDWDEGARPYLEYFLTIKSLLNQGSFSLVRKSSPTWTEDDFQRLLYKLGCAGYGWLRPEGVRRQLETMAAQWQGPPPLG